ncbi:MAG: hypothetical protein U1F98_02740 [Verrucomicrobiota bacterium]
MSYLEMIRLTSGLLQFGVACYALRLGRKFNTAKLGWVLFTGLTILALLYVLAPFNPFRGTIQAALKVDIIYGLISVMIIAGMAQMDFRWRKRQQTLRAEQQTQSEWASQVEYKITELGRQNEESKQIAARLQAELVQAKQEHDQALAQSQEQARVQSEKLTQETQAQAAEFNRAAAEQRDAIARLEAEVVEQKQAVEQAQAQARFEAEESEKIFQGLLVAARRAGMTEVAAEVARKLEALNDELNALDRLANHLSRSSMVPITRVTRMMRETGKKPVLRSRMRTVRAKQLPDRLAKLTGHLQNEQSLVLRRIDFLRTAVEKLQAAIAPFEPSAAQPENVSTEPVVELNADLLGAPPSEMAPATMPDYNIQSEQTETGTLAPEPVAMESAPAEEAPAVEAEPVEIAPLRMVQSGESPETSTTSESV